MSKLKRCTLFLLAFSVLQIEKLLMREALERWLEFWSEFFFLPIWWAAAAGGEGEKWWVGPLAMLIVALAQSCQSPTPALNCINIFAHIDGCRLKLFRLHNSFYSFREEKPSQTAAIFRISLFCFANDICDLSSLIACLFQYDTFLPTSLHNSWFNIHLFQQNVNFWEGAEKLKVWVVSWCKTYFQGRPSDSE